jgi:DNA-binding transcriptional LysR family regulator
MESSDLAVFQTVARTGGITRAALELHTVQSNVTARIQALEREIGKPLFYRHSRGVTLTAAGEALLPYATRVATLVSEATQAVGDAGTPRGPLRVGSLETSAARRLPPILVAYSAAYPDVDITLQTGTSAELIAGVLEHRLEGALVAGPVNHPDLGEERVVEEELVVVSAPSCRSLHSAWEARTDVKILVLRSGCSYRERLEHILERRGIVNVRRLEFGMLDAIIGCAAAGIGVTLLPRAVVEAARDAGRVAIHELLPDEARVETVFIRRRDSFVSSALAKFIEYCHAMDTPLDSPNPLVQLV